MTGMAQNVVQDYLDLLDSQREAVLASLDSLSEEQIWQRPAPREWCVGEILPHRAVLRQLPAGSERHVGGVWLGWASTAASSLPSRDRECLRAAGFPDVEQILGHPNTIQGSLFPVAVLRAQAESTHRRVRLFYTGEDEEYWATSTRMTRPSAWST